jgi:hypothetical protein
MVGSCGCGGEASWSCALAAPVVASNRTTTGNGPMAVPRRVLVIEFSPGLR